MPSDPPIQATPDSTLENMMVTKCHFTIMVPSFVEASTSFTLIVGLDILTVVRSHGPMTPTLLPPSSLYLVSILFVDNVIAVPDGNDATEITFIRHGEVDLFLRMLVIL